MNEFEKLCIKCMVMLLFSHIEYGENEFPLFELMQFNDDWIDDFKTLENHIVFTNDYDGQNNEYIWIHGE